MTAKVFENHYLIFQECTLSLYTLVLSNLSVLLHVASYYDHLHIRGEYVFKGWKLVDHVQVLFQTLHDLVMIKMEDFLLHNTLLILRQNLVRIHLDIGEYFLLVHAEGCLVQTSQCKRIHL